MPRNIEIKARARDFEAIRSRAQALADTPMQVLPQEDTFFAVPRGRLKLRVRPGAAAQLIYYERADQDGPKRSDYEIFETDQPEALKQTLGRALGVRGVVRKTRYLYLVGQTRVHLDDVEGLGRFMELEVVMRPDQSDAEGQGIAEDLMARLGVSSSDLLEGAYMDLLEQGQPQGASMPSIKRINHVAVVVSDVEKSLAFWRDALGMDLHELRDVPSEQSQVAFLPLESSEVELVQPTTADSGIAKYLAKRGPGMHHICLEVDDIAGMLAQLEAKGVRLINEEPRVAADGRKYAFIHPESTGGVLVELYEA